MSKIRFQPLLKLNSNFLFWVLLLISGALLSPTVVFGESSLRNFRDNSFSGSAWVKSINLGSSLSTQLNSTSTLLGVQAQFSLTAYDVNALDEFGWAVDTDGYHAVIGARSADLSMGDDLFLNAGAAYLFVQRNGYWYLEAKLTAKDPASNDGFGTAVAISEGTVLIGAPGADSEDEEDSGAVYAFSNQSGNWDQQAKIVPNDPQSEDGFGSAVDVDGTRAIIGADGKDLMFLLDSGAAYIFKRTGSRSWTQEAKLLATNPDLGDFFGASVAIDRNTVIVGATEVNPIRGRGEGKAYIFSRNGSSWLPQAELRAKDARKGDDFGGSVAISGSRVVVGAQFADVDLGNGLMTSSGAAYVFQAGDGGWSQQGRLTAEDGASLDNFGEAVGIFGDTVVVGAGGKIQAAEPRAGAAYIFKRAQGEWLYQTKTVADPAFSDDHFGRAIAISGGWFIVGASGRTGNDSGEAFMVRLGDVALPETGFAPGRITALPVQPVDKGYADNGKLWLEIPDLSVRQSIVGVSRGGTGWDVQWLGDQIGYLDGTAFPTWRGNTVLAGHTTSFGGEPGPFRDLDQLRWGDEIVVHAWGVRYIYMVRTASLVAPNNIDALQHEELDWVTLITCHGYDEDSGTYRWRRVVRAVLIAVEKE